MRLSAHGSNLYERLKIAHRAPYASVRSHRDAIYCATCSFSMVCSCALVWICVFLQFLTAKASGNVHEQVLEKLHWLCLVPFCSKKNATKLERRTLTPQTFLQSCSHFSSLKPMLTPQTSQSNPNTSNIWKPFYYLKHFKALLTPQTFQEFANTSNISKQC